MKYLIILSFLVSCSSVLNRNTVLSSDIIFKGGSFNDTTWKQSLVFERTSWYKEVNMVYDFSYTELKPESPFRDWLGSEKLKAGKCDRLFIGLLYSKMGAPINTSNFIQQMREANLEELVLLDFEKQFQAHEGYRDWRLSRHKVVGLCSRSNTRFPIVFKVPGFTAKEVLK